MISFNNLIKTLKHGNAPLFMMIGNGGNNQFRYIKDLRSVLRDVVGQVPHGSSFLYFGDYPNKKNPDIGYAFQLLSELRPDINIYMIQIKEAIVWGIPKFVKNVYWHTDYSTKCKWGGVNNNKPCSNTKKWTLINKYIGISKVFILGGGEITLDEFKLIKQLKIDYIYYKIHRRCLGDGNTKINDKYTQRQKIGITYKKIE